MFNMKTIKIRLFIRIIAFILCLHGLVFGEDCADEKDATQTPTPAGNAEYANLWRDQYAPIIYDDDDDDMVDSGGSVKLWVDSGGLAYPPYTWATSNTGWNLDSNETENDLETVTLSLIDTTGKTCGTDYDVYAILTVTDDWGVTDDIVIRYSGGTWKNIEHGRRLCYTVNNCTTDECTYADFYIHTDDTKRHYFPGSKHENCSGIHDPPGN
jgi:hypothetical protein